MGDRQEISVSQTYSRTRLIPAMILGIYTYGSIAALLGTILPQLGTQFGLTAQQSGLVATMQALGLMIASIAVGPIVDNKGKKTGIVAGLAGITAALLCLAYTNSYEMALGAMLLLGLGGGMLVTGANALISDVAAEKRSSALNLLNMFFGLGTMVTPWVAGNIEFLKTSYSLAILLTALAGITLLVNIVTPMPPPSGDRGFQASEAKALLSRPALWLLCAMLFLYVACEVGVFNWLNKYLIDEQGLDSTTALNILSWGFAGGLLVGRVVVSRVLLGVSEVNVTLFCSVVMTVATFAMLQVSSVFMVGAVVFVAGLAMAPMFPTTLGICGNIFTKATATAMGIVITSGWTGLTLSSYIIGSVAEQSTLANALLLLPGMSLALVIINLLLRKQVTSAVA
jgi:fucose permease